MKFYLNLWLNVYFLIKAILNQNVSDVSKRVINSNIVIDSKKVSEFVKKLLFSRELIFII